MASHILIVDHEPSTLKTMEAFLGRFGYRVSSVSSAEEAIRLLEHLEGNGPVNVDVVITDILLPGMNGLDMTDRIKSRWNVDVMVMTGYTPDYSYEAAVSKGASDFVFKPIQLEELNLRLKRVLRERKLNRERLEMMDELKALSITDDLTQLYNSRYFYIHIKMEIDRFNRYGHDLSLLFLDIDLFKIHNDTYGHVEGDKVLVRIAQLIRSCLRKMDTAYRYGGEEFTVILPETPAEEALTVAERLRAVVAAESFPVPGALAHLTISVGVTQYIREESVTDFVKRADAAMYRAKQAGRNKVTCVWGALNSDLSHIRQVNTEKPRAALPMAEKASDPEKSPVPDTAPVAIGYYFLENPSGADISGLIKLYRLAGWWTDPTDNPAMVSGIVRGSHFFLVAREGSTSAIVAMGRAISDRASDAYIQDVTVDPVFRKKGIGTQVVSRLVSRLKADGIGWIGLIAERKTHLFYRPLGFSPMADAVPMLKLL